MFVGNMGSRVGSMFFFKASKQKVLYMNAGPPRNYKDAVPSLQELSNEAKASWRSGRSTPMTFPYNRGWEVINPSP